MKFWLSLMLLLPSLVAAAATDANSNPVQFSNLKLYRACRLYYEVLTCLDDDGRFASSKMNLNETGSEDILPLILQMQQAGLRLRGIESNHYGAIGHTFVRD